jgi:hypothetical protein
VIDAGAMAAITGVCGLGVALAGHVIRYAYDKGATDNRLTAVEKTAAAHAEVHVVLSALTATVSALKESVERLDRALERINHRIFEAREP